MIKSNKCRDEDLEKEIEKWKDNSIDYNPITFIRIDFVQGDKVNNVVKKLKYI